MSAAAIAGCLAFWAVIISFTVVATREPAGRHHRTAAAPIVTEAEVAEEFASRPLAPAPSRPVNGRYLGTQPRRTPGPFTAVDMPALPAPEPTGPARAWDPGDGLGPDVPIARPWTADRVAYGVDRCQLDVAEAERRFALALGPDGCEEI